MNNSLKQKQASNVAGGLGISNHPAGGDGTSKIVNYS